MIQLFMASPFVCVLRLVFQFYVVVAVVMVSLRCMKFLRVLEDCTARSGVNAILAGEVSHERCAILKDVHVVLHLYSVRL